MDNIFMLINCMFYATEYIRCTSFSEIVSIKSTHIINGIRSRQNF